MTIRRGSAAFVARVALGAAVVSIALYGGACGDDHAEPSDELADVIYEGGATDEALVALLDATPTTADDQAAVIGTPEDGAALASPTTFSWSVGATASVDPAGPPARPSPAHPDRSPRSLAGAWSEVEALLGPVRAASAHGTPISGRAYFVVFSTDADPKVLRVFTTATEYTPDDAAWQKLTAAGAVRVSVLNAVFEENRIAQDGGPYTGPEISFTVP